MPNDVSKLEFCFSAAAIKQLLENNPLAKQVIVKLELGVTTQKNKKGKGSTSSITANVTAYVPKSGKKKSKTLLKEGEPDDGVNGYPIPPGEPPVAG